MWVRNVVTAAYSESALYASLKTMLAIAVGIIATIESISFVSYGNPSMLKRNIEIEGIKNNLKKIRIVFFKLNNSSFFISPILHPAINKASGDVIFPRRSVAIKIEDENVFKYWFEIVIILLSLIKIKTTEIKITSFEDQIDDKEELPEDNYVAIDDELPEDEETLEPKNEEVKKSNVSDDTLESDLFNLIDSMYDDKENK